MPPTVRPDARPSAAERTARRRARLLVVLAAVAGHVWVLGLPFRVDDLHQIPAAGAKLADETGLEGVFPELGPGAPEDDFRFRPLLWLTFLGDAAVSGTPLDPLPFYATTLVLHLACALALLLLFERLLPPGAACAGALFFALHPAGAQALSWIAARGDVLATLCAILAVERLLARPRAANALAAGVLMAAALAAKIVAYAVFPAALGLLLLRRRGQGAAALAGQTLLFALPFALVAAWRQTYLGTPALETMHGVTLDAGDLGAMVRRLPVAVEHLLVPWNLLPEAAELRPLLARTGAADPAEARRTLALLLAPLPLLATLRGRSGLLRLAGFATFLAASLSPALFVGFASEAHGSTRLLYGPTAGWAFGIACAADVVLRHRGPRPLAPVRTLGAGLLLAQALVSADALVHEARVDLHVARRVGGDVDDLRRLCAHPEALHLVAVDGAFLAGVPVPGTMIGRLFSPPFSEARRNVVVAGERLWALEWEDLRRWPGPIALHARREGRFTTVLRVPPAPRATPRLFETSRAPDARTFRVAPPVAGRGVRALRFTFAPGGRTELVAELTADGTRLAFPMLVEESGEERRTVVDLAARREWRAATSWTALRLRAPRGLLPALVRPPAALRRLTGPELLSPAPGARLPYGRLPTCVVSGVPPGAGLRLTFRVHMPALASGADRASLSDTYVLKPDRIERDALGRVIFVPGPGHERTGSVEPGFHVLATDFAPQLRGADVRSVQVAWRAELVTGGGGHVSYVSTWQGFELLLDGR